MNNGTGVNTGTEVVGVVVEGLLLLLLLLLIISLDDEGATGVVIALVGKQAVVLSC